jgi:hypothetical protein
MLAMALLACAVQDGNWHPQYSKVFRANPTGPPNHVAVLTWFGSTKQPISDHSPGALMLDLYELPGDGSKRLVTSTKVADGLYATEFRTHDYSRKEPKADEPYFKDFGHTFLSAMLNGGQHSRLIVWEFDWHTLRPTEMLNVLYGDPTRLDVGLVTENTPANYVHPDEWPKGVKKTSDYISRYWTIGEHGVWEFAPGPWRLTTDRRFKG